ncbi:MAG: SDR family oxidoreductase [Hyphomicrobiaceae bacterium]|nr:SDR family oxidoreductase [Hyphomicrobiaceae bacterium]MCC0024449.1 SDR family oxidoreductase [Hyphomicrobiaceae bacterium]
MTKSAMNTLITGGTQGLGLAVAEALVRAGHPNLAIAGLPDGQGPAAIERLKGMGANAHLLEIDLSDAEAASELVLSAEQAIGPINALVNSAAICDRGSLLDTSAELFDRVLAVNTRAPFLVMQTFAKRAIANGIPASCVNVTSLQYHCGLPFLAPYSASKAALAALTKNAANALKSRRIRFNAVALGWMDTPGEDATQKRYHNAPDDWLEKAEASQPFGQLIKPDEVAGLILYLLSPESGVITGSVIDYDQTVVGASPEGIGSGE